MFHVKQMECAFLPQFLSSNPVLLPFPEPKPVVVSSSPATDCEPMVLQLPETGQSPRSVPPCRPFRHSAALGAAIADSRPRSLAFCPARLAYHHRGRLPVGPSAPCPACRHRAGRLFPLEGRRKDPCEPRLLSRPLDAGFRSPPSHHLLPNPRARAQDRHQQDVSRETNGFRYSGTGS